MKVEIFWPWELSVVDLNKYLKESGDFVLTKYPWKSLELANKVVKVDLKVDSYPVVPICKLQEDGLISVFPLL